MLRMIYLICYSWKDWIKKNKADKIPLKEDDKDTIDKIGMSIIHILIILS